MQEGIFSVKKEFWQYSKAVNVSYISKMFQAVDVMPVFKNYLAGNLANGIRFSQSRTRYHWEVGVTKFVSQVKWKHIFSGPRLAFTCKNMIKTDVSEGSWKDFNLPYIYTEGPAPVMPWRKLTSTLCTDTGSMVAIWSGDLWDVHVHQRTTHGHSRLTHPILMTSRAPSY